MAFLRPGNLKSQVLTVPALASLSDYPAGIAQEDMRIFYINVCVVDTATPSFTGGTITLEWDDNSTGDDTAIDVITVADDTALTSVTQDDLSSTAPVPAGSRFLVTSSAGWANAAGPMTITIWYNPIQED